MRIASLLFLILLNSSSVMAQILSSSNLPIVVISTDEAIPDEPKIQGTIGIIDNSPNLNNLTDPFNHYSGNIGIETRGNSTQGFDKISYSVELRDQSNQDTSASILGMGKEEDWILHAMVIDKSQLRIPMSFYLFQRMGHYASNWRYVELVVNGDYRGLYILCEKIKRDDDRVDIAKLDDDDLAGDSVTGGYILRIDWLDDPQGFTSNYNSQAGIPMTFQWYYPKASKIKPEQATYIEGRMDNFEDALFSSDFTNGFGERYTDLINLNSFTDFLIINELSKNADGYKLSSFVHKDKDSKDGRLNAGPIWDFDQTYGVSLVCSNHLSNGWTYLQNQDCEDLESMPMWWQQMMSDTLFQHRLKCRWEELRQGPLHQDSLYNWIDEHQSLISQAISRNFTKWDDHIGESIWAEPEPIPTTYEAEITYLKNWIADRLTWIDSNLPGNCAFDYLSVTDLETIESRVYPNPNDGQFVVHITSTEPVRLGVLNSIGQEVFSVPGVMGNLRVDLPHLPKGVYLVKLHSDSASSVNRIIIH